MTRPFARCRPAASILAACGIVLLAGCVTPGLRQIQSDLDGIQKQLWKVQKDAASMSDQLASQRGDAARATAPEGADATALSLGLEAADRDLAVLRSRADDADRRIQSLADDLRVTREMLQTLTRTLPQSGIASSPPAPPAPEAAPTAASPSPGSTGAVPGPTGSRGAPGAPAASAASPGPAVGGTPDVLYRQGYADYAKGNDAQAVQELQDFIRRNPQSDLADDAQYLIGEVHYSRQRYAEAIAAFDQLLEGYPGGDKAAAAYLKKGLALFEMNRTADAVIQWQHVISAYPRSEEARIARDRLRALGLKDR